MGNPNSSNSGSSDASGSNGSSNSAAFGCSNSYDNPAKSADDVQKIVDRLSAYFQSGVTLPVDFRMLQLKRMQAYLRAHEREALEALHADLGKSEAEAYATELGMIYDELRFCLKYGPQWARPRRVPTSLAHFPTTSTIYPYPFGVVGIYSPWNYPLQLSLLPLVDAVCAGNCVLLKPSQHSRHTSAFIRRLCQDVFDPNFIFCLEGSNQMNDWLLDVALDKIMFTGSPRVGREIMAHAAQNLTSVTLELGGKSPVFITPDADLRRAGERIAWGKCLNSGQTCVGPDYILIHESVADSFVNEFRNAVHRYYGEDVLNSPDYPHMIDQKQFDRVCGLIDKRNPNAQVVIGGGRREETLQIEPTVMTGVTLDDPVMGQEIFGPVLPIITWRTLDEAIAVPQHFGHPLSCYIFSTDKKTQRLLLDAIPSGGAVINDVVIWASSPTLPFGGLQNSGIGHYHGKAGFDAFTHYKSTMKKSNLIELPFRNPPFNDLKLSVIKFFLH